MSQLLGYTSIFFLSGQNFKGRFITYLTSGMIITHKHKQIDILRYSNRQKVELFLFGSTELTNSENIEIFSHVQHFIRESNRFSFSFSSHYN